MIVQTDEIRTPAWRTGKAYAEVQSDPNVVTVIKAALSRDDIERHKNSHQWFPILVNKIRVSDLGSNNYWLVMFTIVGAFFLIELSLILSYADFSQQVKYLVFTLIFGLLLPVIIFLVLHVALLYFDNETQPSFVPNVVWSKLPTLINVIPVLWLAVGMILINFWLVAETGMRQSPFLPAFLTSVLTVIGLPRENSKTIYYLSLFAIGIGLFVCITPNYIPPQIFDLTLSQWGSDKNGGLPVAINLLTFLASALCSIILRIFTIKIKC